MTDIIQIPLSKLVESEDNVRRSHRKDGVAQLAASIEAIGLLQSLVVRETSSGKYAVIAGGRRLRALRTLAKTGSIPKNEAIPCRVVSAEEAQEMSLAENIVRVDLCPADEIEAIAHLAQDGQGVETIAARFGVSPSHVARRLKLARLSPRLIDALKREDATLDQLAALAFTDDHAAQEAAFFEAPDWARTPERLKAYVTQAHVPETDKLARFVGLEAYEAEGGAIVRDLFAEDDDRRWLTNRALLTRLAEARLEPFAASARGEGWAWVEVDLDGPAWSKFPERVREHRRTLSAEEAVAQEQLYARLDGAEDEAEIEAIEKEIDALTTSDWDKDEVALAGALITLAHDGTPKIERGLVKLEDVKRLRQLRRKSNIDQANADDAEPICQSPSPSRLPAKLVDELLAHKTLGLRVALLSKPDLALRLIVFALAARALGGTDAWLHLRLDEADLNRSITRAESPAITFLQTELERKLGQLPKDTEALWAYTDCDHETLLSWLAALIAPGVDLRAKAKTSATVGDLIAETAGLEMSAWWTACPESFFAHVRKDVIIDALIEHKPTLDRTKLEKMAKPELLSRAKRSFKGSSWLPAPLRTNAQTPASPQAIAAE